MAGTGRSFGKQTPCYDARQAMSAAKRPVHKHALESIRASRVASALDYHPDYLGRLYRRTYGIPMTEAVNRRRIREAKRDLLESPLTIEQIAVRCGFADAEYFRRVFRKLEGMTPSGYRRLYARFHVNSE